MDGLGFVRRGLILSLSAGVAATAVAQHPAHPAPQYHRAAPSNLGWQYYRVPNGPYISPGVGRGAFVGPAWGPGFGGGFPGFYGIPGAAGSVWTNNLSLYGPPIPTYGPVPGVFGQNDMSRLFFDQPGPGRFYGVYSGLGWAGRYSPSPRGPATVSVYPPAASSVTVVGNNGTTPGNVLRVCVKLPNPDATLWVERQALTLTGTERTFESSNLEVGQTYRYELIAKWKTGGRDQAETRTVTAKPGEVVTVDFNVPE